MLTFDNPFTLIIMVRRTASIFPAVLSWRQSKTPVFIILCSIIFLASGVTIQATLPVNISRSLIWFELCEAWKIKCSGTSLRIQASPRLPALIFEHLICHVFRCIGNTKHENMNRDFQDFLNKYKGSTMDEQGVEERNKNV